MKRAERIKELIEKSGKSYSELEKLTGIKKSSLQRYASGITAKIPLEVIEKLSSTFNVSQSWLMGYDIPKELTPWEEISPSEMHLTEGEEKMLELFRLIPENQQQMALEMIRAALKSK